MSKQHKHIISIIILIAALLTAIFVPIIPVKEKNFNAIGPNDVNWDGFDKHGKYHENALREKKRLYAIKKHRERISYWAYAIALLSLGYNIYLFAKYRPKPNQILKNYYDSFSKFQNNTILAGRIYERYIGYLQEQQGYNVIYWGTICSYLNQPDGGIDLIAIKDNFPTRLIQCKRWKGQITPTEITELEDNAKKLLAQYAISHPCLFTNRSVHYYTTTGYTHAAQSQAIRSRIKLNTQAMPQSYPVIKILKFSNGATHYLIPEYHPNYDLYSHVPPEYVTNLSDAKKRASKAPIRNTLENYKTLDTLLPQK